MEKRVVLYLCIIFSILWLQTAAFGQTGGAGTDSPFGYGLHARTLAMGNAAAAYPQGSGAMYWNPGGMGVIQQKSAGLSLSTLFEGTSYTYAGYVHPTLNSGVFGFGVAVIGTDGIVRREWEQNVVREYGEIGYWWGRFTLAYSLEIIKGFSAGLSVDANRKVLGDWSANGFGVNGGLHYSFPQQRGVFHQFYLGCSMENIFSPRLRLGSVQEILPYTMRIGAAKRFGQLEKGSHFLVLADIEKSELRNTRYHLGMEYGIGGTLYLRAGFNAGLITFGAGFRYRDLQLDYGAGPLGELDLLPWGHRFTLQFLLGKSLSEKRAEIEEAKRAEIQRRFAARMAAEREERISSSLSNAREFLDRADYFNSRLELMQVLREDAQNQEARQLLELVETKENEYQDARRQELLEEDRERNRQAREESFINDKREEANKALAENDFRAALRAFEAALNRDPDNLQLQNYRSQTEARLRKEITDQIARARSLVSQESISSAYKALDIAADQAKDNPELASRVTRERLALDKEVDFIHNYQEGKSRYDKKDYEGALPFLHRAQRVKPDHVHVREMTSISESKVSGEVQSPLSGRAKELYFQGINLFKNGKVEEALEAWDQALKLAPNNGKILKTIHDVRTRYIDK